MPKTQSTLRRGNLKTAFSLNAKRNYRRGHFGFSCL